MGVVRMIVTLLRAFLLPRAALAAENLALRQQLAVLQVSAKRPRLRKCDRVFWVWLSRFWSGWRSCLMIVKPETVVLPENSLRVAAHGLARFAFSGSARYASASHDPNGEAAMGVVSVIVILVRAFLSPRAALAAETLALRQQLAVLQVSAKRPKLRKRDRLFWVWLSRLWSGWRSCLMIVKPETVIRWHREGFRLYWRWKSRKKLGRPKTEAEIRKLIRQMARQNPTWGAPRIQSELALLGLTVAESTVAKYMGRARKPPSQTWRTFLDNHVSDIVSVDFFVVATMSFHLLYCFLVLRHDRRRVVHFNVTPHPTARWTSQQVVEAFPFDTAPRFLIRDRDGIYGDDFRERIRHLGIEEVVIAYRSPWQSPYIERLIGSIRRECLDHMIVLNEVHLMRILRDYFAYYHEARTHLSLGRNAPDPREVERPNHGRVIAIPQVGGLHHRYTRAA